MHIKQTTLKKTCPTLEHREGLLTAHYKGADSPELRVPLTHLTAYILIRLGPYLSPALGLEAKEWTQIGWSLSWVPWTARKSTLNIHWKDWCWSSNTLATWCEEPTHWKDPDAGNEWRQEKGTTEDEMAGWYHRLNGHEFEQTLGDGDGLGSMVCCNPWGRRVRHNWAMNNNNQSCSLGHE